MSRINTNVSSLTAQTRLNRTNKDLQTSLTRLSTGLRINSGADDPAGLIASEALRSDITGLNKALSNTQRASQIISTADSALGQVSSLLNDIRGLVVEAANNGALSDDEIAANQLQVDSSLEAINRIAQTTTFQGRKLLDGSLDFITKAGAGFGKVSDLKIDQANLGATGKVSVDIAITSAATKATIGNANVNAASVAVKSTGTITFGTPTPAAEAKLSVDFANSFTVGAEATKTVTLANSFNNAGPGNEASTAAPVGLQGGAQLSFAAKDLGAADGLKGNSTTINITTTTTSGGTTATYDAGTNSLNLVLEEGLTGAQIETALAANADFAITDGSGGGPAVIGALDNNTSFTNQFTNGSNTAAPSTFVLSAVNGGIADGEKGNATTLRFTAGASNLAEYNADTNEITVTVADGATTNDITSIINSSLSGVFTASNTTAGQSKFAIADVGINAGAFTNGTNVPAAAQLQLTAIDGGPADGTKGNSTTLVFTAATGGAPTSALFDADSNELRVTVGAGASINDIKAAIDTDGTFAVSPSTLNGTSKFSATDLGINTPTVTSAGTDNTLADVITIQAKTGSSTFDKNISFATTNSTSLAIGAASAAVDSNGNIVITTRDTGNVSLATIRDAVNTLDDYTATITASAGDATYNLGDGGSIAAETAPTIVNLTGGAQGGGLGANVVFQVTGGDGAEVFQFEKGATLESIIQSVNLVKDATGVEAINDGGNLRLNSTKFGSKGSIAIEVISEGAGGTFKTGLSTDRSNGKDIVATVNGYSATGNGNSLSINTSTLDLSLTVEANSTDSIKFEITGGGALFQLGGDVVSNQQARLGIDSVSTAKLGGSTGRLFELGSGQANSLAKDPTGAAKIIDDVINKVTGLRGRLGAFQRTTLDSNAISIGETVSNLQEAESSIRDADFAAESAKLTRNQILVQSGTSVLGIANQNPQNVLSLLR